MGDEQPPLTLTGQDPAPGPMLAPGLIPAIERNARPGPAPLWQSVGVALLVLAVLASIALGIARANDRWGDAAQSMTAAAAFKAMVSGDTAAFLALIAPEVRPTIGTADVRANEALGRTLAWEGPTFADGAARLVVRRKPGSLAVRRQQGNLAATADGTAVFTPDPERADLVRMTARGGPLGEGTGTIQLVRTLDGWRVTAYRFHGFIEPTATPGAK